MREYPSKLAVLEKGQDDVEYPHPDRVWSEPQHAQVSLEKLQRTYLEFCRNASPPKSPETITKYDKTLTSYLRSLARQGEPLVLASVTPETVRAWMQEQRAAGLSEDGIASRLGALKIFTNKYVYKELDLTTCDLLRKVARFTPPERPPEVLTEEEIRRVLDCYDRPTFEDIRNRALVATYIVTGLRLREVLELRFDALDRITGEVRFIRAKGGRERTVWLSQAALKHVKAYLRIRPQTRLTDQLWVQADGKPLRLGATHTIMLRLRERSGIARLHWHLFRHGFAQTALKNGADIGTVQEMLGHATSAMTRRYAGRVRQLEAARRMPQYAPAI